MSTRKKARPKSRDLQGDTTPPEEDAPVPAPEIEEENDGSFKCEDGFYNGYCYSMVAAPLWNQVWLYVQNRDGEYVRYDRHNPAVPIVYTDGDRHTALITTTIRDESLMLAYEMIDGWTIK